ncbi:MAG TPA: DinB family protein [Gemmatimonadaceae bacterium]|nr:DinB family protein [Gemmatimonadaceae bacterium]
MTLQDFLAYWPSVRARTTRLIPLIPADRVEWTPAPGRWTLGDTLRHLAGIERWMYAETVHGRPMRYPGHGPELADGLDAITAYHTRCHEDAMAEFRALTPEQWTGKTMTAGGVAITTWKWLRAMIEHEAHHRGQMYLMLGLLGVATPPLYGLTEEEVARRARE